MRPDRNLSRHPAEATPPAQHNPLITPESALDLLKRRIDSPEGRALYARRLAIVEPVFANLRHNKRLDRFTSRGRRKVDMQWKLDCLVHNLEKLAKLQVLN
jgi:hypothetical protein